MFHRVKILATIGFACFSLQALATLPERLTSPIQTVAVQHDSKDHTKVRVFLTGDFVDSCYRSGRVEKEIDIENKIITLRPYSYDFSKIRILCYERLTPFVQKISLGILPPGKYQIKIAHHPELTQMLYIGWSGPQQSLSKTAQQEL